MLFSDKFGGNFRKLLTSPMLHFDNIVELYILAYIILYELIYDWVTFLMKGILHFTFEILIDFGMSYIHTGRQKFTIV
jgi:hypothetical protein